jgi:hypothetical protein
MVQSVAKKAQSSFTVFASIFELLRQIPPLRTGVDAPKIRNVITF